MTSGLAILVNGLPAAGKTTLARVLAAHLGLPLFSKDTIKEAHANVLGTDEARHPRHPIHGDLLTDDEWEHWRLTARPLEVGPVLRVDTARPADAQAVADWIRALRRPPHPGVV